MNAYLPTWHLIVQALVQGGSASSTPSPQRVLSLPDGWSPEPGFETFLRTYNLLGALHRLRSTAVLALRPDLQAEAAAAHARRWSTCMRLSTILDEIACTIGCAYRLCGPPHLERAVFPDGTFGSYGPLRLLVDDRTVQRAVSARLGRRGFTRQRSSVCCCMRSLGFASDAVHRRNRFVVAVGTVLPGMPGFEPRNGSPTPSAFEGRRLSREDELRVRIAWVIDALLQGNDGTARLLDLHFALLVEGPHLDWNRLFETPDQERFHDICVEILGATAALFGCSEDFPWIATRIETRKADLDRWVRILSCRRSSHRDRLWILRKIGLRSPRFLAILLQLCPGSLFPKGPHDGS